MKTFPQQHSGPPVKPSGPDAYASASGQGLVLLLGGCDDGQGIDRAALRQAGFTRVRGLNCGAAALDFLARLPGEEQGATAAIELIVCAGDMPDMDKRLFLKKLNRLHSTRCGNASCAPVLVITGSNHERASLLGLGASAVLCRPYSLNALADSIRRVKKVKERSFAGNTAHSVPLLKKFAPGSAGDSGFFAARQQKAREKLDPDASLSVAEARQCMPKPMRGKASGLELEIRNQQAPEHIRVWEAPSKATSPDHADRKVSDKLTSALGGPEKAADEIGLPQAGKGPETVNPLLFTRKGMGLLRSGRPEEARELLRQGIRYDSLDLEAAFGLARASRELQDEAGEKRWLNRAALICLSTGQKERAESIFERLPEGMDANPRLYEAKHLLIEEDYDAACELFLEVCNEQRDTPMHVLISRTCQFTGCPELAIRQICSALSRKGFSVSAGNLHNRLLADAAEDGGFAPRGLLANFPRLYEAVAVARFALHAWRRAAV